MKILYILPLLLFCNISFAQELPVIPMKNGLVYYEFKHTLKNTSKCLSKYIDCQVKVFGKLLAKKTSIKMNPDYIFSFRVPDETRRLGGLTRTNCQDTILNKNNIPLFTMATPIDYSILYLQNKNKIKNLDITALVEVIFLNKNEYILKFKDFQYNVNSYEKKSFKLDQVPLGEIYNNFLSSVKKSKDQIKLYNTLNLYIKSIDEVLLETLTELYQADEL